MKAPAHHFSVLFFLLFCVRMFAQTTITTASHEVGAEAVSYQILVRSSADWTATKDADWVTLSRTGGSMDGNVLVNAAANATGADRVATIQVNGATHTLTQRAAGVGLQELWAFGSDANGQLGDNVLLQRERPCQLDVDVKMVAAGTLHTLIVKTDGSLWATGDNGSGQLGDGTTPQRSSPVQILSGGVQAVAAGYYHSLVVKTDGSLWAMGSNSFGQLGDGTITQRNAPVRIFPDGVQNVAAGYSHSLVLKTDGSLWAMGDNSCGQLGSGTTIPSDYPVEILSGGGTGGRCGFSSQPDSEDGWEPVGDGGQLVRPAGRRDNDRTQRSSAGFLWRRAGDRGRRRFLQPCPEDGREPVGDGGQFVRPAGRRDDNPTSRSSADSRWRCAGDRGGLGP